jgi:hypothetical protein
MNPRNHWRTLRRLFASAFATSRCYAIATIGPDGAPHVTPIGALILRGAGRAFFFEEFTRQLGANLDRDPRVCVLAVDAGRWLWLRALFSGRFPRPPAVRLRGRVLGPARPATEAEKALWLRRVRSLRPLPGYRLLWADMARVRELVFEEVEPVETGAMTAGLWAEAAAEPGDE